MLNLQTVSGLDASRQPEIFSRASDLHNNHRSEFIFNDNPSAYQLRHFIEAINRSGHLPYHLSKASLVNAPYQLIASTVTREFAGGCTIKTRWGLVFEIGHMFVLPQFRRLGLGHHMTRQRIKKAKEMGAHLLVARVRNENPASIANLQKAGFRSLITQLSKDRRNRVQWFCLPLTKISHSKCRSLFYREFTEKIIFQ